MGNSNEIHVNSIQICCHRGICTPQYEITFQEFEYKSRVTPSPTVHQEIFKSFAVDADSQLSSLDTSRQIKLEQALNYAKRLKLQVVSSSTLKRNTEYSISPLGYEFSQRAAKDGVTYFGVKKKIRQEEGNVVVNDIIIPLEDSEIAEQHRGQHFCVYYDITRDSYFIRDLSVGFGSFVKVLDPLLLKDNYLIQMGEHYLLINLLQESVWPRLKIKVFGPPCVDKLMFFNPEDHADNLIKIGRAANCDIMLDDSLVSKLQSIIEFKNCEWILRDGDGYKNSTNGIWLYMSEAMEIKSGMVFKSNHTVLAAILE